MDTPALHVLSPYVRAEDKRNKMTKSQPFMYLDSICQSIDSAKIKTVLFEHQRSVIAAMKNVEDRRVMDLLNAKLYYSGAVLSEPVGSGKTVELLAHILNSPLPKVYPTLMPGIALGARSKFREGSKIYMHLKYKNILKPTIIFVGASVLNQWEDAIKRFTDVKYFVVRTVFELRILLELIRTKKVNEYQIILVKNKKITVPIIKGDVKLPRFNSGSNMVYRYESYAKYISIERMSPQEDLVDVSDFIEFDDDNKTDNEDTTTENDEPPTAGKGKKTPKKLLDEDELSSRIIKQLETLPTVIEIPKYVYNADFGHSYYYYQLMIKGHRDDIEQYEKISPRVNYDYMYNRVALIRNVCWSRVVIDDFNHDETPHSCLFINSLFTWFVSSTNNTDKKPKYTPNYSHVDKIQNLGDVIELGLISSTETIKYNDLLFEYVNIRTKKEYIASTMEIPYPKFRIAHFINPNERYVSLVNALSGNEISRVMEMLNANAIGEAAKAVGIQSNKIKDVFKKILGDKYQAYIDSTNLIEFIDFQLQNEGEWLPIEMCNEEKKTYGKRDLYAFKPIEYRYPNILNFLKEAKEEQKEINKVNGAAVDRVRSNIKQGDCPVCGDSLMEKDVTINLCCCLVLCSNCGINSQKLKEHYSQLSGGICAQCRQQIAITDLVFIGSDDIRISQLEKANIAELDAEDLVVEEKIEEEPEDIQEETKSELPEYITKLRETIPDEVSPKTTKIDGIIRILVGKPLRNTPVDIHIDNMMKGTCRLKEKEVRKLLVFANYDESLNDIEKKLVELHIKFWKLEGTPNQRSKIALDFQMCAEPCILIVNSSKHCAGLNLQTATDLIFYHYIIDPAIETQVAGRGHRIGRFSPLNVWYFCYQSEEASLRKSHIVRNLNEEEIKTLDSPHHLKAIKDSNANPDPISKEEKLNALRKLTEPLKKMEYLKRIGVVNFDNI